MRGAIVVLGEATDGFGVAVKAGFRNISRSVFGFPGEGDVATTTGDAAAAADANLGRLELSCLIFGLAGGAGVSNLETGGVGTFFERENCGLDEPARLGGTAGAELSSSDIKSSSKKRVGVLGIDVATEAIASGD